MARSLHLAVFLATTLGLVTSLSLRDKRALPPAWTSIEDVSSCFSPFQLSETATGNCVPLQRPKNCSLDTWYELSAALGVVKKTSVAPPAYLSIMNHQDCLLKHRSGNHIEFCLPSEKPSGCPNGSWEKMQEKFDGLGCPSQMLQGVRVGRPKYLGVPGWQMCLLTYKSGGHIERCMPGYQPDLCSDNAWRKLKNVFSGAKCPKRSRLITRVGPPAYLSVQGHQDCLQSTAVGSHTVKCMPRSKPESCESGAWFTLQSVFDGIKCPQRSLAGVRIGAPAYLSVGGFEDCLRTHQASETHEEWCFPDDKPDSCIQDSWEQLKTKFDGIGCKKNGFFVGGPSSLPPRYLDVEDFDECLKSYKASADHEEMCLPNTWPSGCGSDSWLQLQNVFVGVQCPETQSVSQGAPAYLSIPGHRDCLGQEQHPSGAFTRLCLLLEKREGCQQESLDQLKQVFEGPVCVDQSKKPVVIGADALPPIHLSVPNHQDCLGTQDHPEGFKVKCLFLSKPDACPLESFDQLQEVFEGDFCDDQGPLLPLGPGGLVPEYLVDGHDMCLGEQVALSGSYSELCRLNQQPVVCDNDVWATVDEHFNGNLCRDQDAPSAGVQGPLFSLDISQPLYLVKGHKKCLGDQPSSSETSNELCKLFKQPSDCDDGVWTTVSKYFDGDYCQVQPSEPSQRLVGAAGVGAPAYLTIPDFKKCLGTKDIGDYQAYCKPSNIKTDCPEESWKALQNTFEGEDCNDFLRTLPPAHLSIPHHQDCLGTHESTSGTHLEACLPHQKPEGCQTSTWNEVIDVFKGEFCRENLNGIPEKFNKIDGALKCLEDIIEVESGAKCMPISPMPGCSQENFDNLMAILFDGTTNAKSSPLRVGPPLYLSIQGHEKCLSTQPSGAQIVKCMPVEKPGKCDEEAWELLSVTFTGDRCKSQAIALPPAFLFVDGHEECLGEHQVGTHVEKCLPLEKPENCNSGSWKILQKSFRGGNCRSEAVSLYPEYLTIEGFEPSCLEVQASGTHLEKCLPMKRPAGCTPSVWSRLQEVFTGASCRFQSVSLYPEFMGVEGYEDCLRTQTTGSHSEKCIPSQKPPQCTRDAWIQLQSKFQGGKCGVEIISFYPQYLTVPGYDKCLQTQVVGSHIEKCLPDSRPVDCLITSWNELQTVFTGAHCTPQSVSLYPEYLSVPGFRDCLSTQDVASHRETCLPSSKPSSCSQSSWNMMQDVFNGGRCGTTSSLSSVSLYPEYLAVDGYEKCLGIQPSGFHIEKCIPHEKPQECKQSSWNKLLTAFTGSKCYRKPVSFYPDYLQIEGHEKCLEVQASGSHFEKCLPSSKPLECSSDAWAQLKPKFQGARCGAQAVSFYPAYLTVPMFENCLETQVSGTHIEKCFPSTKPTECEQSSFDELQQVFTGAKCTTQSVSLYPEYLKVPGSNDCLDTQNIGSHVEKCLPTTMPPTCMPDSWVKLQDVFKGAKCNMPRSNRALFGLAAPAYLSIPGHSDCLSTQAVQTHVEYCLPLERPSGCNTWTWNQVQNAFHGSICYPQSGRNPRQVSFDFGSVVDGVSDFLGGSSNPFEPFFGQSPSNSRGNPDYPAKSKYPVGGGFDFGIGPGGSLRSCTSNSNCNRGETCHSVGYPGYYCVPANKRCRVDRECPAVGNYVTGRIGARCSRSGFCQYDRAMAISK